MLKVTAVEDKNEQSALCRRCALPYLPRCLSYRADDGADFAGICQFYLDEKGGHLVSFAAVSPETAGDVLFLLGRTALNFMDLCGAEKAYFEGDDADPALLARIGFRPGQDGRPALSLVGFFEHPCQHHTN